MTAADDLLAHELAAEAGERLLKLRAGGGDADRAAAGRRPAIA